MISNILSRLKGQVGFLVLVAVAGVGAWLYVQFQQVRADRDDLRHRAEVICAGSGIAFDATPKAARGALCARRVADLVAFKSGTDEQTARILADAMAAQAARSTKDNIAARNAAEAARAAAIRMETADAEAERRNLVDREWFAAVNGVAGLRAPSH